MKHHGKNTSQGQQKTPSNFTHQPETLTRDKWERSQENSKVEELSKHVSSCHFKYDPCVKTEFYIHLHSSSEKQQFLPRLMKSDISIFSYKRSRQGILRIFANTVRPYRNKELICSRVETTDLNLNESNSLVILSSEVV